MHLVNGAEFVGFQQFRDNLQKAEKGYPPVFFQAMSVRIIRDSFAHCPWAQEFLNALEQTPDGRFLLPEETIIVNE